VAVAALVLVLVLATAGPEAGLAVAPGRAPVMAGHPRQLARMNRPRRRTP